ncbi:Lpg1974 family pore-forming outer membrane protein [Legionella shakespearei]|uniref:Major outer membrane protein n=1 Tax=Legionella shakespearei DSM 23087 TaxID=1122169 RepID=A0A0W0YL92_9GAMM|nr:Lpg1974 family pore-forming outer membrane protein [Legionella shakespearei]KTD57697.1 major outer membrane protein [Legionella shakespearei DSM 23087]
MLGFTKTAAAVLTLGSSVVYAGTMGPVCTPGNVTVPCERSAWDFGVQAVYLVPSFSPVGAFVGSSNRPTIFIPGVFDQTGDPDVYYNEFQPDWAWGFRLEGSYHFNTGNDLNLNWLHYKHTTNQTINLYAPTPVNPFGIAHDMFLVDIPTLDVVNLEFGQHVDFGERKDIRFHGGFEYVRYHHVGEYSDLFGQYDAATLQSNLFGPRVGADYMYNWGNGLAMYAKGATALLAGTSKMEGSVFTVPGAYGSKRAVIPMLEAKTGATYTYSMPSGDLTLDAGWMWMNFFEMEFWASGYNAIQTTNLALDGPYVGLKWVGNV